MARLWTSGMLGFKFIQVTAENREVKKLNKIYIDQRKLKLRILSLTKDENKVEVMNCWKCLKKPKQAIKQNLRG